MPTTIESPPPTFTPPPEQDFWRTPHPTGAVPDGTNDETESIARRGPVALGPAGATRTPIAVLDVGSGVRTSVAPFQHNGNTAQTPLYVTGPSSGWSQGPDFVPMPLTANVLARFRHNNGSQGLAIGYNGIQHESSAVGNTTFMLGTAQANSIHARGWNGWLSSRAIKDNINAETIPDGGRFEERWLANNSALAERRIVQADVYRPGADQRQAFYDLLLAQTGGGFGMRAAYRIAPVVGANGNPHATNIYNSFTHYLNPVANNAILAGLVLWQAPNVLEPGADTTNSWAGIGTVAGPQGGTHATVFTQGRVNGPHHFIGAASRAAQISGTATAPQQSILTLFDDGARSRVRFGLGLPTSAAGLSSGELWNDNGTVKVTP